MCNTTMVLIGILTRRQSSVNSIQQCQMGKLSTTDTSNPFQPASSLSPSLNHGRKVSLATKGSKPVLLFEGNRLSPSGTKSFQGGNERRASAFPPINESV